MPIPGIGGVTAPNRRMFGMGAPSGDFPGLEKQYKLYDKATEQQMGDYGSIMDYYKNLIGSGPSSEYRGAYSNLQNLASTGGYSTEDIANIRARGVSPIRAVYANANRDIDRNRALKGGYSPGYSAVKARMASEMSSTLSDKMTDINAGIAERIAQNKIGLAGQLTNAAGEFDATKLRGAQGATGLYGTTPALAQLFGNQALNTAQLQNQINQQNYRRTGGYSAGGGVGRY